jgi:hypothetical protein
MFPSCSLYTIHSNNLVYVFFSISRTHTHTEEEEKVLKERGGDRGWVNPFLRARAIMSIGFTGLLSLKKY